MTTILSAKKPQMALVALLIVLSTLLAACGDSTATPATQPTTAAATTAAATTAAGSATTVAATTASVNATTAAATASSGPVVKINVFAPQEPTIDLATNSFTKEISQKLNIQFTWQSTTLDGGPAKEKRQISLASGDYPDLYMLINWVDRFSPTELQKYAKQGVVLPLNDLIKQYAPNVQAAIDNYPDFKAEVTSPDGKIYGIAQYNECYHCLAPDKLWMNSEWLKKLNLQQPKTTEDLRNVLMAFKTKDPNGNGKADEIPLSANVRDVLLPYLMDPFIYNPQSDSSASTLVLNNGKVDLQGNKDGWKQGLAYIKSLYDAGLIDQGAFTQNPDALKKEGDNADTVILGAATVKHPAIFFTLGSPDGRDKKYDAVAPLTGPGGLQYATYGASSSAGAEFVLTNKASKEVQIASMKLIDYLFSQDGQTRAHFGAEGKSWRKPQAGDVAIEKGVTPLLFQIRLPAGATPYNDAWGALAQYFQPKSYRDAWVQDTDIYTPAGYERRLQEATHLYDGKFPKEQIFPFWGIWIDPAVAGEAATLQTNIDSYVNQNSLQFITGSKSLEKDWDAYVKRLDQLGLKRYLEIQQQAYDKSSYKK